MRIIVSEVFVPDVEFEVDIDDEEFSNMSKVDIEDRLYEEFEEILLGLDIKFGYEVEEDEKE